MNPTKPPTLSRWRRLAWVPIPLLVLAIAVLWIANLRTEYLAPRLQIVLNFLTRTMASVLIVYLAGRSFLVGGAPGLLLLGCGVAIWGAAGVVTTALVTRDVNLGVTISNLGAWLSALCYLAGAALAHQSKRTVRARGLWLGVGYALALGVVALVTLATFAGWLPVFFVQGQGGTLVRHVVLGSAIAMIAITAGLLGKGHRRASSRFIYWYTLALLLIAAGLFGVMIQASRNTMLEWMCRAAQYLGGVYLLIAALASRRESRGPEISLATVAEARGEPESLGSLRHQTLLGRGLRYGLAAAAVAAAFGFRWAVTAWGGPGLPTYITFYPAVMVVALLAGFGPGLVATVLTCVVVGYWVLPPVGQFAIDLPVDRLGLAIFAGMGVFMSVVAELYQRSRQKAAAYDREAALRETRREKEFLANLLEHAAQPFAVGYPDGRIGRLNRAYEQLTGYTAAELRALDWSAVLTPPEWREREKQKLDELRRTGQPVRYEKEYVRKDGSRVPIELLVQLERDPEGRPDFYYSFIADITERRRAEQAARESEQQLRRLNAELQAANTSFNQSRAAAINLMEDAVTARQRTEQAGAALRQEVTERQQAEEQLRTTLQRFYDVLASMYAGVLLVTEAGQVEFANQAICDQFGLPDAPADLVGLTSRDMLAKIQNGYQQPNEAVAHIQELLARGEPVKGEELTMQDGRTCLRDFIPLNVQGRSCGRLWIHIDITERQRAEEALRRSEYRWRELATALQESEERYRTLFNTLLEGFCIIEMLFDAEDRPVDYRFLEVNPAFEAQTGLHDALGKRMRELAPEHETRWFEMYGNVALTGEPARLVNEAKALQRWYDVSAYRVGGPGSRKVAILFNDITERQRAEQALQRQEADLREAQRMAHIGSWYWDARTDVTTGSDELLRIYGFDPATQSMPNFQDQRGRCYPAPEWERVNATVQRTRQTGAGYELDVQAIRDGAPIWLTTRSEVVRDAAGQIAGLRGTVQDITERKRAEEALRKLNEELEQRVAERTAEVREKSRFLEAFFATSLESLVFLDRDFNFIRVNDAYARACQRDPAEFVGHNHFEFFPNAENQAIFTEVVRTKQPFHVQARAFTFPDHPDWGVTYWDWSLMPTLDARGEVDFLTFSLRDVTELENHQRYQEELVQRRSAEVIDERNRLTALMDALPVGVALLDERGGNIRGNAAFDQLWGGPRPPARDIRDYDAYQAWWPDTGRPLAPEDWASARAVGHGETVIGQLLQIQRFDGTRAYVLNSAAPIRNAAGQIAGSAVAILDVTALRQAEEQMRRLNRTLQARSRSSQTLLHASDEAAYLREVCAIVVEDCGHRLAWIGFAHDDAEKSIRPVAHAGHEDGYLETLQLTWADTGRGRGPGGTAIRTGQVCQCRNMLTDPEFAPWREEAARRGYASSIVLPLLDDGRAFGELTIYSGETERFAEDEVKLLTELANDVAYGVRVLRLRAAHAQAEAALRESEEKLRLFAEHAPAAIAMLDHQMRYVATSQRWLADFGLRGPDLRGRSYYDVFPEIPERWKEIHRRCLTGAVERADEDRFDRADGSTQWIRWEIRPWYVASGAVGGIIIFSEEITARKRAEEQLRQSAAELRQEVAVRLRAEEELAAKLAEVETLNAELALANEQMENGRAALEAEHRRYADLFDLAPDGYVVTDLGGVIREINVAACRILGQERQVLLTFPLVRYFATHEQTSAVLNVLSHFKQSGKAPAEPVQFDADLRFGQRPPVACAVTVNAVLEAEGKVTGLRWLVRDITARKLAEQELAAAKQRLDAHMDNSPLAVIEFDPEFRVTRWSREAERLFGWTAAEVTGRAIAELQWVHEDDAAAVRQVSEDMLNGRRPRNLGVNRNYGKDGRVVHCEWYNSALYDAQGRLTSILSQVLDITERQRMEQSVRENRARLAGIVESAMDAIVSVGADQRIVVFNTAAEQMFRCTAAEALGSPLDRFVPRRFRQTHQQHMDRFAATGQTARRMGALGELHGQRADGEEFPIEASISHVDIDGHTLFTVIMRDVTERLRAERGLQQSEQRFHAAVDHFPDAFVIYDTHRRLQFVNSHVLRTRGRTEEEMLGHRDEELYPPGVTARYLPALKRAMATRSPQTVEWTTPPELGERILTVTYVPVVDINGEIQHVLGITHDITEERRAMADVHRLNAELEQRVEQRTLQLQVSVQALREEIAERKRLETQVLEIAEREQRRIGQDLHDGLGQQLAGIAYLSNALHGELARKSRPEAPELARIATLLKEAIDQTRGLARGLRPVEREPDALMTAFHRFAPTVQELFRVTCRFDCPVPVLVADNATATHLFRIAQEAVHNAIKHGKAKRVRIGLRRSPGDDALWLQVTDNGKGFRGNPRHTKGMGLDTMRYRAQAIGGSLAIRRARHGGTVVTCAIPLSAPGGTDGKAGGN